MINDFLSGSSPNFNRIGSKVVKPVFILFTPKFLRATKNKNKDSKTFDQNRFGAEKNKTEPNFSKLGHVSLRLEAGVHDGVSQQQRREELQLGRSLLLFLLSPKAAAETAAAVAAAAAAMLCWELWKIRQHQDATCNAC